MSRQIINEIKAMLELHLSAEQIAHRLCISIVNVQDAILAINNLKRC